MITEAIYGVVCTLLAFLVGLLPSWEAPSWLTTLVADAQAGVGGVAQLGHWIALEHIGIAAMFLLTAWTVAFAMRGGRIVLSALTGGGGSAA